MRKLLISAIAIILSIAFVFCGCTGENGTETTTSDASVSVDSTDSGYEKSFVFEVVDADGNKTQKTIETDGEYVGEVLQRLGLINGEQGDYGIYIKEVNGITADYDVDGTYWAFYVNDVMSMTGADMTPIVDGEVYSFRVEKG